MGAPKPKTADVDTLEDCELLRQLSAAIESLESSPGARKHFAKNLNWLKDRQTIWTNRMWRVGLVGITSSGKSTLVNALIGERLLPARVQPSSNVLVLCAKGEQTRAVVHFEKGRASKAFVDDIAEKMSELTDEVNNPHNEKGVAEIELFTTGFFLDPDVVIVDTPGLDAHQLDGHERLTMEFFLPTVDAVIYLTTAKSNADREVCRFLDRIASADKPLILAQNMIDSVVPKLGRGAREVRSAGEVIQDHRRRLVRLLEQSDKEIVRKAPVIQLSAMKWLSGDSAGSNLEELRSVLREQLRALAPRLAANRRAQLARHLQQIVDEEGQLGDSSAALRALEKRQAALEGVGRDIADLRSRFGGSGDDLLEKAKTRRDELLAEAEALHKGDIDEAESLRRRIDHWRGKLLEKLLEHCDGLRGATTKIASRLNLRDEDYVVPVPRDNAHRRSIDVATKEGWVEGTRERKGFWGGVARFFGMDYGHESYRIPKTYLDADEFAKAVRSALNSEIRWLTDSTQQLASTVEDNLGSLCSELDRERSDVEHKQRSTVESLDRTAIAQRIAAILADLRPQSFPAKTSPAGGKTTATRNWEGPTVETEVPRYVLDLIELAHLHTSSGLLAARDACLSRVPQASARRIAVWAWDADSLERFLTRFWFDVISGSPPPSGQAESLDAVGPFDTFLVANEGGIEGRTSALQSAARRFFASPATVFLLLDAMQEGSTRKQIERSLLREHDVSSLHVVVVAQSVRDLVNANELAAGMRALLDAAAHFKFRLCGALANDDSLVLSALLDRLALDDSSLRTQRDEERWQSELAELGSTGGVDLARVLRDWRDQRAAQTRRR